MGYVTFGRSFLASSPMKVMVRTVVMPREILSEVASLFNQNETQEITTSSMQGPYTCQKDYFSQNVLNKYISKYLNDKISHVSFEMETYKKSRMVA